MTREKNDRGTESRFVTFSEGLARFKRRVAAEGEPVDILQLLYSPFPLCPWRLIHIHREGNVGRAERRGRKRRGEECLVSATQWGHSLKGLKPRRPKLWVRVTSTRKREGRKGGLNAQPSRAQGEHPCGRARNLIGRYLNAPVTRDICATYRAMPYYWRKK